MDVPERMNLLFFCNLKNETPKNVIDFCMNVGLIEREHMCPKCGKRMNLRPRNDVTDKFDWVCRVYVAPSHYVKRSVRSGSFFAKSNLPIPDILLMTYLLLNRIEHSFIMYELNVSSGTVCDWHKFVREVYMDECLRMNEPIGGVGMIVEIDVSNFNKGKKEKDKWVFGGVERGTGRMFFKVVENRNKDTLLNILKTFVLPGTTIYSDCLESYDCLKDEGFIHLTVNHSLHFKDPETGVHTNTIEGTWSAIKRSLPSRTVKGQFDSYLAEYVWRRVHADTSESVRAFFKAVANLYRPSPEKTPNVDSNLGTAVEQE